MLSSKKVTVFLSIILTLMIISSVVAFRIQKQRSDNTANPNLLELHQRQQVELRSQFPTVDYNAPESSDAREKARRKIKSSRYDRRNFVSKDPSPHIAESARILEGYYVPAIPVKDSNLIITGEVLNSEAHLSNDKSSVYTELNIHVDEVLNNNTPSVLTAGEKISVTREGGVVRYRNGHDRVYRLAEEGMPGVGRKYVLFLKVIGEGRDYKVLTAYEMTSGGISPVDFSPHFLTYKGFDNNVFLTAVRAAIKESQQPPRAN